MKLTAVTLYIVFLIFITGLGVGGATEKQLLIKAALPMSALLILALRLLGPNKEQIGWAAFTGWLGMTYLQTGGPIEVLAFFVCVALGALGIFRSSYFLVVAWLGHIVWDFLPRELPENLHDLPLACTLFDGLIGLYLLWGSITKRWTPFFRT